MAPEADVAERKGPTSTAGFTDKLIKVGVVAVLGGETISSHTIV
jgi:hypothetical protein